MVVFPLIPLVSGHYYSIGECDMPVKKIKCPQCGLAIWDADHILTDENARAMDLKKSKNIL